MSRPRTEGALAELSRKLPWAQGKWWWPLAIVPKTCDSWTSDEEVDERFWVRREKCEDVLTAPTKAGDPSKETGSSLLLDADAAAAWRKRACLVDPVLAG
jgi:hypothetical protein